MQGIVRKRCMQALTGLLLIILSGCALGAGSLQANRRAYNRAIHRTGNEELLLNLLRVRYGEPVQFVQVASVVASFNYAADLRLEAVLPFDAPEDLRGPRIFTSGAGVAYAELPTVTYVPLEGQQFASQMLRESSVNTLMQLMRGGWRLRHILPIMIERIGPLINGPESPEVFARFLELINLWGDIQDRGGIHFENMFEDDEVLADGLPASAISLDLFASERGPDYLLLPRDDGKFQLLMAGEMRQVINFNYANPQEAERVRDLLGLPKTISPAQMGSITFIEDPPAPAPVEHQPAAPPSAPDAPVEITVALRSFADQLFYVAHGIPVPAGHQSVVLDPKIQGYKEIKDLLRVHHDELRPDHAFVAVPYRDAWFYIDDRDPKSKWVFQLLTVIFALQAQAEDAAPGLTIPVGN